MRRKNNKIYHLSVIGIISAITISSIVLLWLLVTGPVFENRPDPLSSRVYVDYYALTDQVRVLTSIQPPRNYKNIDSLNLAKEYIADRLRDYCPEVKLQEYSVENNQFANIVCTYTGEFPEKIIIGAHYDVAGNQPGADDNASSVAGLLELARLLQQNTTKPRYTVELIAFTLEEPPFFRTEHMGSFVHAKSLRVNNEKVKLMISLDMIGYYSDALHSQSIPVPMLNGLYPNIGNFIAVIGKIDQAFTIRRFKKLMKQNPGIDVYSVSLPEFIPGIDFSDHLNYWKFGYPGMMITDTGYLRNPNYHKASDTADTLNYEKIAEVIKSIYWAITRY